MKGKIRYKNEIKEIIGGILIFLCVPACIIILPSLFAIPNIIEKTEKGDYVPVLIASVSILVVLLAIYYNKSLMLEDDFERERNNLQVEQKKKLMDIEKEYKRKENDLLIEFARKRKELDSTYFQKEKLLNKRSEDIDLKENRIKNILQSSVPFKNVASLYADAILCVYDEASSYLKHKSHPAISAANEVKRLKSNTRIAIEDYKQMLYKYDYLLNIFPELKKYVDDEEALVSLDRSMSYNDFKENRDCSRDYLSQDEWDKLSITERNQLALDRYKTKPKSNWKVGMEYEMYIEYLLRENGYKTVPFGSLNGLNDLGRDIIAFKTNNQGNNIVYIIQCKNWSASKNKLIHENVVCQIFGSAMEYQLRHRNEMFLKVFPVIFSTVPLSDMAQAFAKKLGVLYEVKQKGEYPMIKCNISKDGARIYHLPFDQQYYRTEICKPGECYVWTVKEAEDKGFRRALKYNFDKS